MSAPHEEMIALLRHAARLARLEIDDDEIPNLSTRVGTLFAAFAKLADVETSQVEPLYCFKTAIETRADEPREPLAVKALLAAAPRSESGHIVVPRVIGSDDAF